MQTTKLRCSGDRDATVTRCHSPADAGRLVADLVGRGAPSDDVAVIVRHPSTIDVRDRRLSAAALAAGLGVVGLVAGAFLFGLLLGLVVGLLAALVGGALGSGQRASTGGAVAGSRYDVVVKGEAVALVDAVLGRAPAAT